MAQENVEIARDIVVVWLSHTPVQSTDASKVGEHIATVYKTGLTAVRETRQETQR
jgi:hypothetical protein